MFEKGNPGRPKGSQNKNTRRMAALCDEFGDQWIEKVKSIALNDEHKDQMNALNLLGKKMFPDLKAVEHTGDIDTSPRQALPTDILPAELDALEAIAKKMAERGE